MKPSEKIHEIYLSYGDKTRNTDEENIIQHLASIVQYLDEEWEKKQESERFNKDFSVHDAESKLQ